jgi:hypothetical protein
MDIKARLDEQTLRRMLGDILPITVLLDDERGMDGRWVKIGPADRFELLPGEGVRLATSGELRWPVKIAPLMTVTLNDLQVLVRPIVLGEGPSTRVLFRPRIERMDLQRLPSFIDRGIVALVNRELEARSQLLAWRVADSLGQRFSLPETLIPLETASVDVLAASLTIDDHGIELAVTLDMNVTRVGNAAAPAVGGGEQPATFVDVS